MDVCVKVLLPCGVPCVLFAADVPVRNSDTSAAKCCGSSAIMVDGGCETTDWFNPVSQINWSALKVNGVHPPADTGQQFTTYLRSTNWHLQSDSATLALPADAVHCVEHNASLGYLLAMHCELECQLQGCGLAEQQRLAHDRQTVTLQENECIHAAYQYAPNNVRGARFTGESSTRCTT